MQIRARVGVGVLGGPPGRKLPKVPPSLTRSPSRLGGGALSPRLCPGGRAHRTHRGAPSPSLEVRAKLGVVLGTPASAPCTWRGPGAAQVPIRAQPPATLSPPRLRVPLPSFTWLPRPSYRQRAAAKPQLKASPSATTPDPAPPASGACWHGRTAGPRRLPPTTRSPSRFWTSWIRRNSPALRSQPCVRLSGKPRKVWQRPKQGRTPAGTRFRSERRLVRNRDGLGPRKTPA